jgi:hypothetical protein
MKKQGGMAICFLKTVTAVIKPDRLIIPTHNTNYRPLCTTNTTWGFTVKNVHLGTCDWVLCSGYRVNCVCEWLLGLTVRFVKDTSVGTWMVNGDGR